MLPSARFLALACSLFLCSILAGPLVAGDFVDVAINGQDDEEKQNAYQVAMRWLLQRRGDGAALSGNAAVREALRNAERYVDEFEFREATVEQQTDANFPVTSKVRETGQVTHILRVTLAADALAALLTEQRVGQAQGAAPESSPESTLAKAKRALVWLLVQDAGRDIMIGPANAENVVARLRELAGGLGWNLYFPTLDTLDLSLIGPAELSSEKIEAIEQASQRYQQRLVLSGVLSRDVTGRWRADWLQLPVTAEPFNRQPSSSTEEEAVAVRRLSLEPRVTTLDHLLQQGVAWLTGHLDDLGKPVTSGGQASVALPGQSSSAGPSDSQAQGHEVQSVPANELAPFQSRQQGVAGASLAGREALIWIGGVESSRVYARSLKLFKSIATVDSAQPRDLRRGGILFVVKPRAAIEAIAGAARASSWLRTTQSASNEEETQDSQAVTEQKSPMIKADLYLQLLP